MEKNATSGQGNTIKSNACYRNVFDTTLSTILCNSSIEYYKKLENEENIDLNLKEIGYLWLLSSLQFQKRNDQTIRHKDENISFMQFLKINQVEHQVYSKDELKKMFPQLKLSFNEKDQLDEFGPRLVDIDFGLLGMQCGSLAPDLLVKAYEQKYKSLGGEILYDTEVIDILLKEKGSDFDVNYIPTVWRENEIGALKIKNVNDNIISNMMSKNYILTTGAWINQLLDPLGIRSAIKPKKRQLFRILDLKDFVTNDNFPSGEGTFPFLILPVGGIFAKPILNANCLDVGCSDDIGRRFESRIPEGVGPNSMDNHLLDNPNAEVEFYSTNILPVLEKYFPTVFSEKNRMEKPSAGMYAYSLDKYPVIEKNKHVNNLYFCSGASGSGIMKADSIGRILSSLLLGEEYAILYNNSKVKVSDFSLSDRNLPKETLVL